METRPQINHPQVAFDKNLDRAGVVVLIFLWIGSGVAYIQLPEIIPVHFDAYGNVNRFGSKDTLLIFPIIASFLFLGLTLLNKYPHIFNYLSKITADNVAQQYLNATRMIRFIRLSIVIIFFILVLFTYTSAKGYSLGPGLWFIPLVFALFIIPTAYYVNKSFRK